MRWKDKVEVLTLSTRYTDSKTTIQQKGDEVKKSNSDYGLQ